MTGRRRRFPYAAVLAVAELVVYIAVARWVGLGWVVLATVVTSLTGLWLLRYFGVRAYRGYAEALREGRPPGRGIADGAIGFAGAVGLVLPGFIGDVLGLACVLPPTRALLRPLAVRMLESRLSSPAAGDLFGARRVRPQQRDGGGRGDGDVIDGEVVEGEVIDPGDENGPRSRE